MFRLMVHVPRSKAVSRVMGQEAWEPVSAGILGNNFRAFFTFTPVTEVFIRSLPCAQHSEVKLGESLQPDRVLWKDTGFGTR